MTKDSKTKISIVIPTIKDSVKTYESIPKSEDIEVLTISEGNISEAKNIGAKKAKGDILIFMDDDISFDEDWFWDQIKKLKKNKKKVIGIKGHSLGMLKGRVMIMRKKAFEELGGFDEWMNWSEYTDLCIKLKKKGYEFIQLPHDSVKHNPHPVHSPHGNLLGGVMHFYLLLKHPLVYPPILIKGILRKIGLLT